MKTIKFRAWHKVEKRMFKVYGLNRDFAFEDSYDSIDNTVHDIKNVELIQFTGLKDKNGKEIYEGSILSYTVFDMNDNDTQFIGVVNWFGAGFIATQIPDSRHNGEYGIELYWIHNQDMELEIIGNKFEHKYLLEASDDS